MDHTLNGNGFARGTSGTRWTETFAGMRRSLEVGPVALVVLIAGLLVAIATDGDLPVMWSRALFASLFVSNLVVTDWLIKKS